MTATIFNSSEQKVRSTLGGSLKSRGHKIEVYGGHNLLCAAIKLAGSENLPSIFSNLIYFGRYFFRRLVDERTTAKCCSKTTNYDSTHNFFSEKSSGGRFSQSRSQMIFNTLTAASIYICRNSTTH